MTWAKSRWLAGGLSLLLMAGSAAAQTDKSKEKSKEKSKSSAPRSTLPGPPHRQTNSVSSYGSGKKQATQTNDSRSRPGEGSKRATDDSTKAGDKTAHTTDRDKPIDNRATAAPARKLETKPLPDGHIKVTASGQVREKMEKKLDGEHTQYLAPTGKVQREVVQKSDGTQNTIHYAPNGKVQRTVEVSKDGVKQTSYVHYDRDGKERATETVKVDDRGKEVSKTVVVRQTTVIVKNTTVVKNTTIVRNYDRARYGFVYHPVYVVNSPVFVSWYDPYWYSPSGVLIVHPFRYSWGWNDYGWYRYHRHYWVTYDVYPAPSYWVTDWLIAGYVADRYAASVSAAQAREEARLAHEDADKARFAAEKAREDAEIAEAQKARLEAEARAAKAEARAAKAEAEEARAKTGASPPNPSAAPIDPQTKEALRNQIEHAVAEKKEFAEQAAKGKNPVVPDLSKALADPKHIYPVSSAISVVSAVDQAPAGTLTEGDLVRLEPGQESTLKTADENTLVTMRVMSSKGEEGEAKAGTLVSVSLRSLQDFDSEFRAKLDLGLAEADKNKDQFKSGAL